MFMFRLLLLMLFLLLVCFKLRGRVNFYAFFSLFLGKLIANMWMLVDVYIELAMFASLISQYLLAIYRFARTPNANNIQN